MKPMRSLRVAAALLGLTPFITAHADDAHVALIKSVSGNVTVAREALQLPARAGMQLYKTDRLVSDALATAGLIFKDGTVLSIGPSSDIALRDYHFEPQQNRFAFSVYMARGTALYSSGKIGKLAPEAVQISTPRATVGVRGTRFILSAE